MKLLYKLSSLFVLLTLTSCEFSLIADVTPPPGLQQLPIHQTPGVKEQSLQIESSSLTPIAAGDSPSDVLNDSPHTMNVTGRLINQSGKDIPPDISITLHGFNRTVEVFTQATPLQEENAFNINEVLFSPGWAFFVSTTIDGISYTSELLLTDNDTLSLDFPITIYNTTTDLSVLSVDRLHIFVEFLSPETMRIVELYIISNTSSTILSATKNGEATIPFGLPKQATRLQFQSGFLGERYIKTDNGFADTFPVPPGKGQYQIMYAFEMPFQEKVDFSQPTFLPIQSVIIMSPINNRYHSVKIKGDFLKDSQIRQVEGVMYQTYQSPPIEANNKLQMTILEEQSFRLPQFLTNVLPDVRVVVGLAFFGLALILAGVWIFWHEHTRQKAAQPDINKFSGKDVERFDNAEVIMDAIIALDDIYKAGELPEEAYLERREQLKTRLRELVREE